jgi:hypothetical protein
VGLAAIAMALGQASDQAVVICGAGLALGVLAGSGLQWVLTREPLQAVEPAAKTMTEVADVYGQGYEIVYRRGRPSRQRRKWWFFVRYKGRTWGYLDTDFMESKHWLYVENVYVDDRHSNRGLATALLLCATRTTRCSVVTTSSRTRQGVRFFAKVRAVLEKYGIELRDRPP